MKKIVILLLMILPLPASASVQVMSARLLGSVSATTVVPMGDVESGVSESVQAVGLIPMGGKFQNFYSTTTEGFSGTGSITMELRKNGATIMTCSLTSSSCSDTSSNPSVSAGDRVYFRVLVSGSVGNITPFFSVEFVPTTDNQTAIIGSTVSENMSSTVDQYRPFSFQAGINVNNESKQQFQWPEAGVLSNMYCELFTTPAVGGSYSFNPRLNTASTSMSCVVANPSTTGNDTVNTFSIAANNLVSITNSPNTAPGARKAGWGMVFTPTTANRFIWTAKAAGDPSVGASYIPLVGFISAGTTIEASTTVPVKSGTIKSISVRLDTAPASGRTRTFSLRVNNATSSPECTCTVTNASNTCSATCSVVVNDFDMLNTIDIPSASPASNIAILVAYSQEKVGTIKNTIDHIFSFANAVFTFVNGLFVFQ